MFEPLRTSASAPYTSCYLYDGVVCVDLMRFDVLMAGNMLSAVMCRVGKIMENFTHLRKGIKVKQN